MSVEKRKHFGTTILHPSIIQAPRCYVSRSIYHCKKGRKLFHSNEIILVLTSPSVPSWWKSSASEKKNGTPVKQVRPVFLNVPRS